MHSDITRFSEAVFHRKDRYDFGMTIFSYRDLKVLALVDGKKTVGEIADALSSDGYSLLPQFVKLVKLGTIMMDDGTVCVTDSLFSDDHEESAGFPIAAPA